MRSMDPERFAQIENFIDTYKEQNGSSPSTREIADGIGFSNASVSRYLVAMREQGRIAYEGHRNITTRRQEKKQEETVLVPVLGRVSCGLPKFAEENIEEYVRLPVTLFGRGDFYILVASGESMVDIGIDDGDLVLIRQQNYADPGQVVVALIEDEATLKRYYPEPSRHRIRLHPENPEMQDIYVDDCAIQGVAVKVLKDIL